jgi:hypothetical protein
MTTAGAQRVAACTPLPVSLESFGTEKSPDRVLRIEAHGHVGYMRIHIHGWQFACNVATGEKACELPAAKP